MLKQHLQVKSQRRDQAILHETMMCVKTHCSRWAHKEWGKINHDAEDQGEDTEKKDKNSATDEEKEKEIERLKKEIEKERQDKNI